MVCGCRAKGYHSSPNSEAQLLSRSLGRKSLSVLGILETWVPSFRGP